MGSSIFSSASLNQLANAAKAFNVKKAEKVLSKEPSLLKEHREDGAELLCIAIVAAQSGLNLTMPSEKIDEVLTANRGVFDLLMAFGADPNCLGSGGDYPLFVAAQSPGPLFLELLLKAGADANQKSTSGTTAAWVVKKRRERANDQGRVRDDRFLEILRRYGASDAT